MISSDVMAARDNFYIKSFGVCPEKLNSEIELAIRFNQGCPARTAKSILSDAQELLDFGDMKEAHRKINLAKHLLTKLQR